jgi:calcineurin-like phosphoesterase family protein
MKIVLEKGQNLYFTSDTHYGHSNICRATTNWTDADSVTRDFKSLDHMNDTIVNNINSIVGENDVLIHLGDWSFGGFENIAEFRSRIICKNIHLTYGNHDHHIRRNKDNIQSIFSSTQDYMHLDIRRPSIKGKGMMDKFSFICMHFPIASWDSMNANMIHLHGHTHLPKHLRIAEGRAMDVGTDGNDLQPISLDEVVSLLKNQPIKKLCLPKDHHERRL